MSITNNALYGTYNGTDGTTFVSTSQSPQTNALQVVSFTQNRATSDPSEPTCSGCSLTWVRITTSLWRSGTGSNYRTTLFRALGTPSTGAITLDCNGETTRFGIISWVEFVGVDTSGTNGSGAIVQAPTPSTGSGATPTPTTTLAAFGDSVNNAGYMVAGYQDNSSFTAEGGWNELHDSQGASPVGSQTTIWQLGGSDLTPATTAASGTGDWVAIAIEIKADTGGAPSAAPKLRTVQSSLRW